MKLRWSVKQGGINVETYTKSTCSHIYYKIYIYKISVWASGKSAMNKSSINKMQSHPHIYTVCMQSTLTYTMDTEKSWCDGLYFVANLFSLHLCECHQFGMCASFGYQQQLAFLAWTITTWKTNNTANKSTKMKYKNKLQKEKFVFGCTKVIQMHTLLASWKLVQVSRMWYVYINFK